MKRKKYICPTVEEITVPVELMLVGISDGNGTNSNFENETIIGSDEVEDGDFAPTINLWDTDDNDTNDDFSTKNDFLW